jgi:IS30 family transposase
MSYEHFTSEDRSVISVLLKRDLNHREIGEVLGKDRSSVSKEIRRGKVNGIYDHCKAHHKAVVKRSNSKYQGMKVRVHQALQQYVHEKMKCSWSPEQIAYRWNKDWADTEGIRIYAPSIYKYLYSCYGQSLCKYLTSVRYKRKRRKGKKMKKELIKNRIAINKRPAMANKRKRVGDFEGDTLGAIRSDTERLVGLVDRKSRYVLFKKIKRLKYTVDGYKNLLHPYQHILHSLTLDNGAEHVRHQELGTKTYFCDPYSSWQRGTMENSFKRLRRFIPKKLSLKNYSSKDIRRFQDIMNNTPRKCLNWLTPAEVFNTS